MTRRPDESTLSGRQGRGGRAWIKRSRAALAYILFAGFGVPGAAIATEAGVKVDDSSFQCMLDMTKVRHFYVDNLLGNLDATVAVAQAGQGQYPPGSVVQLVPTEVMVKHQKGHSPETNDWEFFSVDVSKDGSKIHSRGAAEVNNRLGLNCFACHAKAKPEADFICEQTNGCDPIPVTRAMFSALQRTDPRCKTATILTEEDKQALSDLAEIVKTLTQTPNQ